MENSCLVAYEMNVIYWCTNPPYTRPLHGAGGLFRTLMQNGLIILDQNSVKDINFNTGSLQIYFWAVVFTSKLSGSLVEQTLPEMYHMKA